MPFLPPNQQCQSTEGTLYRTKPYKFPMHCSKCVSFWGTSYSRPPVTKSWRHHWLILQLYIGAGGCATLAARVETRDLTVSVVHVASKQATNCVRGSDLIALHANVSPCVPQIRPRFIYSYRGNKQTDKPTPVIT